jgi:FtsZ-binding cell division protein ZapB
MTIDERLDKLSDSVHLLYTTQVETYERLNRVEERLNEQTERLNEQTERLNREAERLNAEKREAQARFQLLLDILVAHQQRMDKMDSE